MKFHCDRCKTRYSIADERVRGKILKIRCKNCSAVITVKEGGVDAGASPPKIPAEPARPAGPGTAGRTSAPAAAARPAAGAVRAAARPGSALQGAFEHALRRGGPPSPSDSMSDAPAMLEAEWYVSIDGEQFGPYVLTEAQDWVAEREVDDDLYCWSEGFDDWLPIDKVSHFRGLRGTRAPGFPVDAERTVVDAPPEAAKARARSLPAPSREDTPIPLFAATMAQISAEAPTEIDEKALPPGPLTGAGARAGVVPRPVGSARPLPSPAQPQVPQPLAKKQNGAPLPKPALPGPSGSRAPSAKPLLPLPARPTAAKPEPAVSAPPVPGSPVHNIDFPPPAAPAPHDAHDDFDIGEPSRVVKLPMLGRAMGGATPAARAGLPGVDTSSSVGRGTGSFGNFGGGVGALPIIQGGGTVEIPRPEILQPNRRGRGLVLPIAIGSAVLIAIVAILVIVAVGGGEDEEDHRVARGRVGGDDLAYQFQDENKDGRDDKTGKTVDEMPEAMKPSGTRRVIKRTRDTSSGTAPRDTGTASTAGVGADEVDLSGGTQTVDGDTVLDVYRKNQISVNMCFTSALKRDPLLKVNRADVFITVGPSGSVTSVSIPSLSNTDLGSCLQKRIKAWRFPRSSQVFSSMFPIVFKS